ncbi:MAG TPA: hypothetical protein VF663_05085 [Telluria sp.]
MADQAFDQSLTALAATWPSLDEKDQSCWPLAAVGARQIFKQVAAR